MKNKIEPIDLPSFELTGFDPIDSFAYKMEYQLMAIQDKINQLIESVNQKEEKYLDKREVTSINP